MKEETNWFREQCLRGVAGMPLEALAAFVLLEWVSPTPEALCALRSLQTGTHEALGPFLEHAGTWTGRAATIIKRELRKRSRSQS